MHFKVGDIVMNKYYDDGFIDVREKRINIVFKVLYVFAIAFGAIFLDLAKSFSTALNGFYLIESCLLSLLLIVIVYIVFYIINEMQCLKIDDSECKNKIRYKKCNKYKKHIKCKKYKKYRHIDRTENSYDCLFIAFTSCFISFLVVLLFGVCLPDEFYEKVNSGNLSYIFAGCATICTMCQIIKCTKKPVLKTELTNKERNILTIFNIIGGQGALLSLFCIMALPN